MTLSLLQLDHQQHQPLVKPRGGKLTISNTNNDLWLNRGEDEGTEPSVRARKPKSKNYARLTILDNFSADFVYGDYAIK